MDSTDDLEAPPSSADIGEAADRILVGVAVVDGTGTQTYVNPAFCRMVGWDRNDLVGIRPPFPYWPEEELSRIQEAFERTLRGAAPAEGFELRFRRRDGSLFDALVLIGTVSQDTDAGPVWVASVVDITDRKAAERRLQESEGRLRLALEAGRLGAWEWHIGTGRLAWSPALEAIHGLEPGTFPGTFDAFEGDIHPDDRERVRQAVAAAVERGEDHHVEYRIVRPDGAVRWVEGRGRLLRDPHGRPDRMLGVCSDVTERREAEEERRRLLAAAEETSRLRDEFLASVSHELRTPLNAMLGWAHMLRDGSAPADALPKALEAIERNAQIQAQLVQDLLDVSGIVRGTLTLQRQPVNLVAIVRAAVRAVRGAATNKGVKLRVALDQPERRLSGDAKRLQQAIWNLLSNAVKFTPRGGRVEVTLQQTSSEATVTVRDTGAGIPPDVLPVIFEPFRRADRGSTGVQGGLGLGLAIVRYVAEAHGGTARADSAGAGRGVTFVLTLPLPPPPASGRQAAAT